MRYKVYKNKWLMGEELTIIRLVKMIGISRAHFYRINKNNQFTFNEDEYKIIDKLKNK